MTTNRIGIRRPVGLRPRLGLGLGILTLAVLARHEVRAEQGPGVPADDVASARVLTLAQALRAARAHQPALQLALGGRMTAVGVSDAARASLLPQLNGTASYTRATTNFVPQPGGAVPAGAQASTSFATTPLWRFGLAGSQLITDFGESLNRWRAARVAADAQVANVHSAEAQISYNVRIAFFTARAAKDMDAVAREALGNQDKHLRQVQGYVEVGSRPEIDLTQARADRATAALALINAENAYAVARAGLNQAMGVERSVDYDLSDEAFPPLAGEDGDVETLVAEAKHARPEIASLRLGAESQRLGLRSAEDMRWPSLGLSGSINEAGPELDRTTWNFSGLVTLGVPIFQGGAINAQIGQAEGQTLQANAQLEAERQQVRFEVEQARLGVRAGKAAIGAAADALTSSRDRLRLAEGRYETGIGSIIELGDAQLALTTSAAQKVQADYQLYTARAQLVKALGQND